MSDNGNGSAPAQAPKAVCAVTLVTTPDGGVQINVHAPGETIERAASHADLTAMAAVLAQWCQTQAIVSEINRPRPGVIRAFPR
jgi:hypothetical protein